MVVFFCPDILIYSLVLTAISRKMNTTELTNLTDHVVYLMLLYSKALVLGNRHFVVQSRTQEPSRIGTSHDFM